MFSFDDDDDDARILLGLHTGIRDLFSGMDKLCEIFAQDKGEGGI